MQLLNVITYLPKDCIPSQVNNSHYIWHKKGDLKKNLNPTRITNCLMKSCLGLFYWKKQPQTPELQKQNKKTKKNWAAITL